MLAVTRCSFEPAFSGKNNLKVKNKNVKNFREGAKNFGKRAGEKVENVAVQAAVGGIAGLALVLVAGGFVALGTALNLAGLKCFGTQHAVDISDFCMNQLAPIAKSLRIEKIAEVALPTAGAGGVIAGLTKLIKRIKRH